MPPSREPRIARRALGAALAASALLASIVVPAAAQEPDPDPTSSSSTTSTTSPPPTSPSSTVPGTSTTLPPEDGPEGDLPGAVPGGLSPQDAATLDELRTEYDGAAADELDFFSRYLGAQSLAQNLALEIYALDGRIAQVQGELDVAQAGLDRADAEVSAARLALTRSGRSLDDAEAALREQAVEAYIGGGVAPSGMSALLKASDANALSTSLTYSSAVHDEQRRSVLEVLRLREEAGALEAQANDRQAGAIGARDLVTAKRDGLDREREQQDRARVAAEQSALEQQGLLAETAERRAEYERRLLAIAGVSDSISGALAERQADQVVPLLTTGIFMPPLKGGAIVSNFGPRVHPIYGVAKMHNGLDIDGDMGTPIRSAGFGEVLIADERGGYGQCVVIDHGNGLGTLYGHMSAFTVKAGDLVGPGDIIGGVGSTGLSTGPHLHFEVRIKGQPVNPLPYLAPDPDL